MSTRGVIGVQQPDGDVVYTWVGHDAGVIGEILTNTLKEYRQRLNLVRGGEICSLCEDGLVDYYDDSHDDWPQFTNSIEQLMQETEDDVFAEYLYVIDYNNNLRQYYKSSCWKQF